MSNYTMNLYDRIDRMYYFSRDKLTNSEKIRFKELPKRYIINENACILFWGLDESEKTIVKKTPKDKFDKRLAFLTAYFQKHSGLSKTQANKYLDNLVVEEQKKK